MEIEVFMYYKIDGVFKYDSFIVTKRSNGFIDAFVQLFEKYPEAKNDSAGVRYIRYIKKPWHFN